MPIARKLATIVFLVTIFAFGLPAGPLAPVLRPGAETAQAIIATGPNTLISDDPGPSQGDLGSSAPMGGSGMTPDGRYVVFNSSTNSTTADAYVFDTSRLTRERVTNCPSGQSCDPHGISADGRWVVFDTSAQLLPGDTNAVNDVYLVDRLSGSLTWVSEPPGGVQPNGASYAQAAISADGRYVAFDSYASNLVTGDAAGKLDVFRYDRITDTIERVSLSSDETEPNGNSSVP